ncbi:MAG: acyl-CoA dehydratase activase [Bacteroidales bacterium]|nr:acyl-CoA dehydratase activase [Bacteroidales bacterium]
MVKSSPSGDSILGIDIGSVSLSIVQLDREGNILRRLYQFHKGNIRNSFSEAAKLFDPDQIIAIACTSSSAFLNKKLVLKYNNQVAIMAAVRHFCKDAVSVLHIGAEKFMLIRFDANGNYHSTRINTSCAAGTGSFLDQQADRLNLSGIEELCEKALNNNEAIPFIASRCAVFSNTDIIHAQQKGFSVNAICDSLCKGLAENINNTVFNREPPALPLLMTGGVSKNPVVRRYLEKILNISFLHNEDSHLFGAIGAGLMLLGEKTDLSPLHIDSFEDILTRKNDEKQYFHKPLSFKLSLYPDFTNKESYRFMPVVSLHPAEVEVDIYSELVNYNDCKVYAGIDIGSTSTKCILIDENRKPVAGFYTYTAGKPVSAVKSILEAFENLSVKKNTEITIAGIGTTGSGRKFIGKIINADLIIDEITSHAKAAYELNPGTDTIIEIGGQDAKFTLMHNGNVTFSQMNSVCAAGTGSFLKEQGKKLGLSVSDYSLSAENVSSPLASDRCAVFMERDINQLLNKGYSVNEILATALHSVTENYLKKVATEASIGQNICFQGATAKNKALVAAFEQRLNKPIYVSKYCHLTGALGTALILLEKGTGKTAFRGIEIYREEIKLETEICSLCTNNCCISTTTVSGEKIAFGFMCGRDYETRHFISRNMSGFDLLKTRENIFSVGTGAKLKHDITIGIPAALHLFEDMPLWKRFFNNMSIRTVTSEGYHDSLKTGKCLAGAEFCAPINSVFGHVVYLSDKADYIFLPVLLQTLNEIKEDKGQYCYYTQFSASLVYTLKINGIPGKCLSPLLSFPKGKYHVAQKLYQCLKPLLKNEVSYFFVFNAFNEALSYYSEKKNQLDNVFRKQFQPEKEISVVLLGRPYVALSKTLNKGIPDIFNSLGIKSFYQDMITSDDIDTEDISILLKRVPWYFVTRILEVSKIIANTRNLYPVLITAFKCAPDSFIIEYFKRIFNSCKKPYLILQIDEHDSNLGYETRIEAAVRSFKNHASISDGKTKFEAGQILPRIEKNIADKTLLFPRWDPIVSPLLVANLRRLGIDARLLKSSELTIKKSMIHNTGQCLPINIIAQEFIEYVEEQKLKPENTMLWAIEAKISCNIRLYPEYTKSILENYGRGFEKAQVYSGMLTHLDISLSACYYAYFAYMLGGLIRMTGCRIRPYEINKGETDQAITETVQILEEAFLGKKLMDEAVSEVICLFDNIPRKDGNKPKVALFGDFYVCDNDIMNQELNRTIEEAGGEIITTPYTDLIKMTLENVIRRSVYRREYVTAAQQRMISSCLRLFDDKYYRSFEKFLGPQKNINPRKLEKNLSRFNINRYHSGESYENILKIFYLLENYPDIKLFVQANPAFCCPSLVTEAMTGEIRNITGVPVVTITYDGTNDYKNDVIIPYLQHRATIEN